MASMKGIQVKRPYRNLTDEEIIEKHSSDYTHQMIISLKPRMAFAIDRLANGSDKKSTVMVREILDERFGRLVIGDKCRETAPKGISSPFALGGPNEHLARMWDMQDALYPVKQPIKGAGTKS